MKQSTLIVFKIVLMLLLIAIPYNYTYGHEYLQDKIWCYVNPNSVKGQPGQSYTIQLYVFCTKQITIQYKIWQSGWWSYNPFYVAISGPATIPYNSSIQLQVVIPPAIGTQLMWINIWDISDPTFFNRTSFFVISNNPSGASFSLSVWPTHIGLSPVNFWYSNIFISSINSLSFVVRIRNNYENAIQVTMPHSEAINNSFYNIGTGDLFSADVKFQLLAKQVDGKWVLPIGNGTYQIELVCYDENNATNELSVYVTITVSGINVIEYTTTYIPMSYYVYFLSLGGYITLVVVLSLVYSKVRRKSTPKEEEPQLPPPPPPSENIRIRIAEQEQPSPPLSPFPPHMPPDKSRICKKCGAELIFKKDVLHCPKCKTYYKYSPLCPRCNRVLKIRGDVWWCDNCAGWIAPNDVKLVIGDGYMGLFTYIKRLIRNEQQEPLPPSPSDQRKYKSQFHCKACGNSFWVYEHRFKVPYCQNCGAPDPIHIKTVEE